MFFLNKIFSFSKLKFPVKLFSLLLISSVITCLSGWLITFNIDRASTEFLQYTFLLWSGILSIYWVLKNNFYKAISIPIIYFYLVLDNSFSLHEVFTEYIFVNLYKKYFNFPLENYFRLDHAGEIIYWLTIFIFIIIISLPGLKSNSGKIRKFIIKNFFFFSGLAFFGIVIDVIGGNWQNWSSLDSNTFTWLISVSLTIFEEIGETFVMSLSCIWLFGLNFE